MGRFDLIVVGEYIVNKDNIMAKRIFDNILRLFFSPSCLVQLFVSDLSLEFDFR